MQAQARRARLSGGVGPVDLGAFYLAQPLEPGHFNVGCQCQILCQYLHHRQTSDVVVYGRFGHGRGPEFQSMARFFESGRQFVADQGGLLP